MINNFVVNYDKTTKINNIDYSNVETINTFTQKMMFYNPCILEPLHKFWYFMPNAKLIKKTSNILTIALSHMDIQLLESIKNLDAKTDEVINKINKSISLSSSSINISKNYPPVIDVCVNLESKCYDQYNNPIMYINIKNNSNIQLYVEFDYIAFRINRCDRKWRVVQLKVINSIDLCVNMFDKMPIGVIPPPPLPMNIITSIAHNDSSGIPPLLGISIPQALKQKNDKPNCSQILIFQPPTQDQLLSTMNKLKKTSHCINIKKPEIPIQLLKIHDNIKKTINDVDTPILKQKTNHDNINIHTSDNILKKQILALSELQKDCLNQNKILLKKDNAFAQDLFNKINLMQIKKKAIIRDNVPKKKTIF